MRVTALAGGVGGAKLANGLAQCLSPEELTIIVNTGDDLVHFGLYICPDLDTVCYTLAGMGNPTTGWGRAGETWNVLQAIEQLHGPTWFQVGDLDLATHLERTRRLQAGQDLTSITRHFCTTWGVRPQVLPMCNQPVPTIVTTKEYGPLPFQEYFVKYHCDPVVEGFKFLNIDKARPTVEVKAALENADVIIFCPSNPWVSIDPILNVPEIRELVCGTKTIAVSPLLRGQTIKGPAAKMYRELGIEPSSAAVAQHYQGLLNGFVYDEVDAEEQGRIPSGIQQYRTDILMRSPDDQKRLADEVLRFCENIGG